MLRAKGLDFGLRAPRWQLLWEPRDFWVGVFFDRPLLLDVGIPDLKVSMQHIYVCFIPCLPIKFTRLIVEERDA